MTGVQLREHTLNRLTYGPSPADRDRYDLLGHTDFIKQQLGTYSVPLSDVSRWQGSMAELGALTERVGKGVARMMHRAITEEHQLVLVLTDLFYNHLNVLAGMGVGAHTFDHYLNDVFASRLQTDGTVLPKAPVLGVFADMLHNSAVHPAMLHYLDNKKNKVGANNENYAREVMELHTIGVGQFDENDVKAATRVLTGWSVIGVRPNFSAVFDGADHDFGTGKIVKGIDPNFDYGVEFTTDGEAEIERFLSDLANHHATGARIVAKLFRRFFGDDYLDRHSNHDVRKQALVDYRNTGTDIQAVLEGMLLNPAFADRTTFRSRIKPPHRFVISAFRVFDLEPSEAELESLTDELIAVGDQPYFYGPPTGYPDVSAYWLTGNGMLGRFQLAETIASRTDVIDAAMLRADIGLQDSPPEINRKLVEYLFAEGVATGPDSNSVAALPTLPSWVMSNDSAKTSYYYAKESTVVTEQVQRALTMLFSTPEFLRY